MTFRTLADRKDKGEEKKKKENWRGFGVVVASVEGEGG